MGWPSAKSRGASPDSTREIRADDEDCATVGTGSVATQMATKRSKRENAIRGDEFMGGAERAGRGEPAPTWDAGRLFDLSGVPNNSPQAALLKWTRHHCSRGGRESCSILSVPLAR